MGYPAGNITGILAYVIQKTIHIGIYACVKTAKRLRKPGSREVKVIKNMKARVFKNHKVEQKYGVRLETPQ